jgi:hypothetical protein
VAIVCKGFVFLEVFHHVGRGRKTARKLAMGEEGIKIIGLTGQSFAIPPLALTI